MSVPDEMVQAAAEALCECPEHDRLPVDVCVVRARIALQAAFAKLPECEQSRSVVTARLENLKVNNYCTCGATPGQQHTAKCIVDNILSVLAREFGG